MLLFSIVIYLSTGILMYFSAEYMRKKPYSQLRNDIYFRKMRHLSPRAFELVIKERYTAEVIERWVYKSSKPIRIAGIFFISFALVDYLITRIYPDFMLISIFVFILVITIAGFFSLYNRRYLTGKVPIGWLISLVVIMALSTIPLIPMMTKAYKESSIIIENENIRITGASGLDIPIAEVHRIFLADTIPSFHSRVGFAAGAIRKGDFGSKSLQHRARLIFNSSESPFLYIIYGDNRYVILNFRREERTLEIYHQLKGLNRD
jgi:hypothetical protein